MAVPEVDCATVARAEEGEVEPEVVQVAAKEEVVPARTFFLHLADAPGLGGIQGRALPTDAK